MPRRMERQHALAEGAFNRRRHSHDESASAGVTSQPTSRERRGADDDTTAADTPALLFDNGFGALAVTGEYVMQVKDDALPPAPWLNVIANERGGFTVSERGAGFTWAGQQLLLPAHPLAQRSGERPDVGRAVPDR
jgi:cellobiose phosphorylase